jgi:uroporphyrinogen III methyltransferase / synthase
MPPTSSPQPPQRRLDSLTVLVLASAKKAAPFCRTLEDLGAKTVQLPAIELRAIDPSPERDLAQQRLHEYDWVIFTSANSVKFFLEHGGKLTPPHGTTPKPRVCAVGPATEADLRKKGWLVDLVPREFTAEGIVESLVQFEGGAERLAGLRVLLPGAKERRTVIEQELGQSGALVTLVAVYENVLPLTKPSVIEGIRTTQPHMIVFTSPSTVRNFVTLFGEQAALGMMRTSVVAALGPVTAGEIRSICREPDIVPDANTLPSLADSIVRHFSRVG